jgi:hypothetical protein
LRFARTRLQVVGAVLVVALLGGTYVYYSGVGGAAGATTTGHTTQSTEITLPGSGGTSSRSTSQSASTSTALTIVSSTTIPCTSASGSSGAPSTLPNYVPLFSSINQMTMAVQQITVDRFGRSNTSSAQVGFKVLGQTVINSTKLYQVNLQVTTSGANGTSNTRQDVAYFDSAGDLFLSQQPNLNLTGSAAIRVVAPYLDPFNYELTSTQQLATYTNPDIERTLNQTTVTLGSTIMNVTYAEPKAIPYSVTVCTQTTIVENVLFAYGIVPGTSYPIITYYYSLGTDGVNNVAFGYKVLTVTRA